MSINTSLRITTRNCKIYNRMGMDKKWNKYWVERELVLEENENKDDAIARHMAKYPEDKNAKTLVIDDIK